MICEVPELKRKCNPLQLFYVKVTDKMKATVQINNFIQANIATLEILLMIFYATSDASPGYQ